jgi:hypothetical protein
MGEADRFFQEVQERKGFRETEIPITREERSSEGETPRALEVERDFQGFWELTP